MSKVFIEESTLTAIGDAIRSKTGGTDAINVTDMATQIDSLAKCDGRHIPDDALLLSDDMSHQFKSNKWYWFLRDYGSEITTENINGFSYPFQSSTNIEEIPFDFNFTTSDTISMQAAFDGCKNLKSIGTFRNGSFWYFQSPFASCYNLRYLPNFENCDFSAVSRAEDIVYKCYSLRSFPEDFLKNFVCEASTTLYHMFTDLCYYCVSLDEINNLNTHSAKTYTSNMFGSAFYHCSRLKNFTFDVQEDGTPYTVKWKNQTIDLSSYVGYTQTTGLILNYNSGITEDKQVTDDATYQALKDDPDWFTADIAYSRYNHDSALATINSLPDTSAYLATQTSGTNIIKFKGGSGSATDGGAINTLTADEVAIATAKGWTVYVDGVEFTGATETETETETE